MITQLSALLHRAATSVEPEKLLLTSKPPSWVHFSQAWPDTHKWARGKYFKVIRTQLVNYPASYILPGDDYADVDLSNAAAGIKLYPTSEGVLYEIALGMKPGDYLLHIFIPKDRYIHSLADPSTYSKDKDVILGLTRRQQDLAAQIERAEEAWLDAQSALDAQLAGEE